MKLDRDERIKTGIYRHYKGITVKVLGIARHSETLEPLVAYVHMDTGELWVRPFDMFFEVVMIEGTPHPRFRYLPEESEDCCN